MTPGAQKHGAVVLMLALGTFALGEDVVALFGALAALAIFIDGIVIQRRRHHRRDRAL